jgi:hypothetical protein
MAKNTAYKWLLAGMLVSAGVSSQERQVLYSNQQWIQYYAQLGLSAKFQLMADAGLRRQDFFRETAQVLGRAGLQYSINPQASVGAGAAYFGFYRNGQPARRELRGWQEFSTRSWLGRCLVQHRLRLEQRNFTELSGGAHSYYNRFRYRLYCMVPITHATLLPHTSFIILGNELFVNFGRQVVFNWFDQNRLLAGAGYKFNESLQVALTYVYQFAQKSTPAVFEESEIFWLTFTHTIKRIRRHDD